MPTFRLPRSRAEAVALDQADPLASARDAFDLPEGVTYLVGHSLGPATRCALERVQGAAREEWARGLVGSWNTASWIDLPGTLGDQIAPLVGAEKDDVVVCDSVSINLFKLAAAVMPLARERLLLVEDDEFPTDQYIAQGLADLTERPCRRVQSDESLNALDSGGVLIKSAVSYRDGLIANMEAYERAAEASGAIIVWDLSHAAGIVPVRLREAGARFAAGCTYKYLNGGPGAPSFLFVEASWAHKLATPLPGWLGHKQPFSFSSHYEPAEGAARFVAGTPGILSASALAGALDVFADRRVEDLHRKAGQLGDLCIARARALGLDVRSPLDRDQRGGHVSLGHEAGYPIVRALAERGIQTDFRTPDTIRLGFSPLFLRYVDVWDTMDALEEIIRDRLWDQERFQVRAKVT